MPINLKKMCCLLIPKSWKSKAKLALALKGVVFGFLSHYSRYLKNIDSINNLCILVYFLEDFFKITLGYFFGGNVCVWEAETSLAHEC